MAGSDIATAPFYKGLTKNGEWYMDVNEDDG
jgi:hypothetical protein